MDSNPNRIAPWVFAGLVAMGLLLGLVWRYGEGGSPARALALKAGRVDLVGQMQVALASAAEAEKSAVLALTDQDSTAFAEASRAATAEVERGRVELGRLLEAAGTAPERALLDRFSAAFTDLRRVDEQVLGLAVQNSNVKAQALANGPALQVLEETDASLRKLAERRAGAARVERLAGRARIALLRGHALLAPHIPEEAEARMDALQAGMAGEAREARGAVAALAALPGLAGDPDLQAAAAGLARYLEEQARVVALSRQNTNVRSLALSLDQKRKAQALCADALAALQQAILEEPIAGVSYGRAYPTR